MGNYLSNEYELDYIELYSPMAKIVAYWHINALGFSMYAALDHESGRQGTASYVMKSGNITVVVTSSYPIQNQTNYNEVLSYVSQHSMGVKRLALEVNDVFSFFDSCVSSGAIPLRTPEKIEDQFGYIIEGAIKLYDNSEIVILNRDSYRGIFKPGYIADSSFNSNNEGYFKSVDHIASELRINESRFWSDYLSKTLNINKVQTFEQSENNKTGMVLTVNQSSDKGLTFVLAEPANHLHSKSKIQNNINLFGAGIHHLAFTTENLVHTVKNLTERGVEFVKFPSTYYDLLQSNPEFQDIDIEELRRQNILIDKEGQTYLLQKFIKPISDRPFFFYEIVQRVNGYNGFALNNINVLKKAEELEIMKATKQ